MPVKRPSTLQVECLKRYDEFFPMGTGDSKGDGLRAFLEDELDCGEWADIISRLRYIRQQIEDLTDFAWQRHFDTEERA